MQVTSTFRLILTSLTLLISLTISTAQQNGGFENWSPSGSPPPFDWMYPTGWTTTNAVTEFISAGVRRSDDAHSGNYAAQISTLNIFGELTRSQLVLGNARLDFPNYQVVSYTGGEPLNMVPSAVSFYYKFNPESPFESGSAEVLIKRREAGNQFPDTVFYEMYYLSINDNYSEVIISIPDVGIQTATDSIVLVFSSNDTMEFGINVLHVDDVSIQFTSSSENEIKNDLVNVYPNPIRAGETLHVSLPYDGDIAQVQLYDATGRQVLGTQKFYLVGDEMSLQVSHLLPGIYHLFADGKHLSPLIVTD